MKKRIILLAGLGIGFVLGSRAGRQSYEKLKNQAASVWNDPKVQEGVHRATETVKEQAPVVAEKVKEAAPVVAEKAKEAGAKVTEAASDAAATAKGKAADAKDKAAQAKDKSDAKSAAPKASTAASAKPTGTEPAKDRRSAPDGRNEDVVPEGPTKSNNLAPAVLPDVESDPEGQMDNEGPDASYIHGQEGKA